MATLGRRLLGLALVALMVGGIALSIAIYNKSFEDNVDVTLEAGDIGNQLAENSDVKVRGLIVGRVGDIEPTATGASLTLHLDPAQAPMVPSNVSARFLPKTLFGERFVSLDIPADPAARSLRNGDVIPQDRSSDAVQVEQALDNLLPVLQAVQPQKLSSTLTAISTALNGRGKPLGDTLSELGDYLGRLNPHLPQLQENLRQLATFSDNLSESTPDLVRTLDNLTTTSRTISEQRQNLSNLYASATNAATDLDSFVSANANNLISLARTARPTAETLAKYAPEYPCFLGQMSELGDRIDKAFGKGTNKPGLHATVEIVTNRGGYVAGRDEPEYNETRGPRCYDIDEAPDPFPQYPPEGPFDDGSEPPEPARSANDGLNPANSNATAGGYNGATGATGATGGSSSAGGGSPVNQPAEYSLLTRLIGPSVGMDSSDVPGWGALLAGPLYRGAEVTVK